MRFGSVVIESFDHILPEKIVTSEEVEADLYPLYERLKLPAGRLELMTGIKERRVWPRGKRPSDLSIEAGQLALQKSSLRPSDIDVLIHASVCRDYLEPATASRVHHHLGLSSKTLVFDLSNACLGVLDAWIIVANMIESGQVRSGMVVAGENGGPLLEDTVQLLLHQDNLTRQSMKKYFANLTIGSGAFASILTHAELAPFAPRLLGGSFLNKTEDFELCQGNGNPQSLTMETDSEALLKAGMELSQKTWEQTKETLQWQNSTPDFFITHQVGKAHRDLLFQTLHIDPQKDFSTFPLLGNTGSVALPMTLSMGRQEALFRKGDLLALLGIGSGLHSIMLGVEWNSL